MAERKKILIVGEQDRLVEFSQLNPVNVELEFLDQMDSDIHTSRNNVRGMLGDMGEDFDDEPLEDIFDEIDWDEIEVVIDLGLDDNPQNLFNYCDHSHLIVIGCAVKTSLAEMVDEIPVDLRCWLFGMNALPTFINRPVWEVSAFREKEKPLLESVLKDMGFDYEWVDDRIGMVTPRVVTMIINEAFFMLGEGTANMNAIDQAMKLGTNYPFGPFEWAEKMGMNNVLDVLEKVYDDTMDPRYRVAPALKKAYFKDGK